MVRRRGVEGSYNVRGVVSRPDTEAALPVVSRPLPDTRFARTVGSDISVICCPVQHVGRTDG